MDDSILSDDVHKEIRRLCTIPIDDLTDGERALLTHYLFYYPSTMESILDGLAKEKFNNVLCY